MMLLLQLKAHYKNTIGLPQVLSFHKTYGAVAAPAHWAQYNNTKGQPQVLIFLMTYGAVAPAQGPGQEHN